MKRNFTAYFSPPIPMNVFLPLDREAYDAEQSDDLIAMVRKLIDGTHPGIFATVDRKGAPDARWMSTLSFDEFPYLYTLTAARSRKVDEIRFHPQVSWLFSNQDLSLVVKLVGKAVILNDPKTLTKVWNQIKNKSNAYFLKNCTEGPDHLVIRTTVAHIECTTPTNAMRFSVDIDAVRSATATATATKKRVVKKKSSSGRVAPKIGRNRIRPAS